MPTLANKTHHKEVVGFLLALMKACYNKQEQMLMVVTNNLSFHIDVKRAVEIAISSDFVTIKQLLERARIKTDAQSKN